MKMNWGVLILTGLFIIFLGFSLSVVLPKLPCRQGGGVDLRPGVCNPKRPIVTPTTLVMRLKTYNDSIQPYCSQIRPTWCFRIITIFADIVLLGETLLVVGINEKRRAMERINYKRGKSYLYPALTLSTVITFIAIYFTFVFVILDYLMAFSF